MAEFAEASQILSREGKDVLQYGATNGYDPLKEYISKWMAPRMGRETKPDEMLITTGSQEGMDLLCSVLLNDGDTIIVEGPTYPRALHAMRNRGRALPLRAMRQGRTPRRPAAAGHRAGAQRRT